MVEISGIEPLTSCVQGRRSPSWAISPCHRLFITLFTFITHSVWVVGLSGLEPPTSPLSGVRSNHLSYRPKGITAFCSILSTIYQSICVDTYCLSFLVRRWSNRRFPYGYLVTTSPQSLIPLWTITGLVFGLRVKSTPMVWRAVSTRPGNVFTVAWLIYDY